MSYDAIVSQLILDGFIRQSRYFFWQPETMLGAEIILDKSELGFEIKYCRG